MLDDAKKEEMLHLTVLCCMFTVVVGLTQCCKHVNVISKKILYFSRVTGQR